MNTTSKAVVAVCSGLVILIMSSLIMSACTNAGTNNGEMNPPTAQVPQNTNENTGTYQSQFANIISADDAKGIAFSHAKVAAENAERYKSELDRDDGRRVYEIEFYAGEYEYEYKIDAANGEILKFDKEKK